MTCSPDARAVKIAMMRRSSSVGSLISRYWRACSAALSASIVNALLRSMFKVSFSFEVLLRAHQVAGERVDVDLVERFDDELAYDPRLRQPDVFGDGGDLVEVLLVNRQRSEPRSYVPVGHVGRSCSAVTVMR
jgi:hypothetical protein